MRACDFKRLVKLRFLNESSQITVSLCQGNAAYWPPPTERHESRETSAGPAQTYGPYHPAAPASMSVTSPLLLPVYPPGSYSTPMTYTSHPAGINDSHTIFSSSNTQHAFGPQPTYAAETSPVFLTGAPPVRFHAQQSSHYSLPSSSIPHNSYGTTTTVGHHYVQSGMSSNFDSSYCQRCEYLRKCAETKILPACSLASTQHPQAMDRQEEEEREDWAWRRG